MTPDLSAVILAGGKSRRLGIDKTALRIGGKSLLARLVELLAPHYHEVIVVTNTPEAHRHPLARLVTDVYPGKGALGGVYSGLAAAARPYSAVLAADMPFINPALLAYLASLADAYDVVVPVVGGQVEPLHAVYSTACLAPMQGLLLAEGTARIYALFDQVRVRRVERQEMAPFDPQLLSLFNINTLPDLERARHILRQRGLDFDDLG